MQTTLPTQTVDVGAPLEEYRVGYRSIFSGWPSAHAAVLDRDFGHFDWCQYCRGRAAALADQAGNQLEAWFAEELRSGQYGRIWLSSLYGHGGGE